MGIPTLIKELTADDDASLSFVDGASDVVFDSTYDEYMFVFTDIGPATDGADFTFQVNATADAGGGYDTSQIQSTVFQSHHGEDDATGLAYVTGEDQTNGTAFQTLSRAPGNGADESCVGILHIFSPASTTYVKHFYSRTNSYYQGDLSVEIYVSGYINDTTAIDEIQFKMDSGNFDGVIQMSGIA